MICPCHPKNFVCPNNPHQYWVVSHDGSEINRYHYQPTSQPNIFTRFHLDDMWGDEDILGRDMFATETEALEVATKRLQETIAYNEKYFDEVITNLKNTLVAFQQKLSQ